MMTLRTNTIAPSPSLDFPSKPRARGLLYVALFFAILILLFGLAQQRLLAQATATSDTDTGESDQAIYLPLVFSNLPSAVVHAATGTVYSGTVTAQGQPVLGTAVNLDFFDGQSWSTYTTTTDYQGRYLFSSLPPLDNGKLYYISWLNRSGDASKLGVWACWPVTINTQPYEDYRCDFDVSGVALQNRSATSAFPAHFAWQPRNIATDTYEFNLIDPTNLATWWWTDPALGYTSSYTLTTLPTNFVPNRPYGWFIWLYSQEGYGLSYYYQQITFGAPMIGAAAVESTTIRRMPTHELLSTGNSANSMLAAAGLSHKPALATHAASPWTMNTQPVSSSQSLPDFLLGVGEPLATNDVQSAATTANVVAVIHGGILNPQNIEQFIQRPERSAETAIQRLQQMQNGSNWVFYDDHTFVYVPVGIGSIVRSDLFPAVGTWQLLSDGSVYVRAATASTVGSNAANRYDMAAILFQDQNGTLWAHVGEETSVVMTAVVNNTNFGSNSYKSVLYWLSMN